MPVEDNIGSRRQRVKIYKCKNKYCRSTNTTKEKREIHPRITCNECGFVYYAK